MQSKPANDFKKYLSVKYILSFSIINYLQSGISFLISILLARELGRLEYGYFTYGLVFVNTLWVVMQFGTDKTLVRDLVQQEDPDLIISSATWLWLVAGIIITVGTCFWAFFFGGLDYKTAIIVLISANLGFVRGMSPMPWFDYKGQANYQSFIILIDRILFLLATVAIIFFLKNQQAIINISIAQLVSRVITLAWEFQFVAKTSKFVIRPVFSAIKKLMNDNVWVWLAGLGNLLMLQVNQLILNDKAGVRELALYGFSFQVIMIVRLLQQQVLRLLTPSIAVITHEIKGNSRAVKNKLYKFCCINMLLSFGIILPSYFIIPYLIGHYINKDFLPALPVLNIHYAWSMLFGGGLIINQFLIGLRLQRFYFISAIAAGLLSLVLANYFINKYGAVGAALSLLISHACSIFFQLFIVVRQINKNSIKWLNSQNKEVVTNL